MKRLALGTTLLALLFVGCGDDDDGNDDGAGGEGTSAGAPSSEAGSPSTGTGGGSPGAAGSGNVACDPELDGVCQNAVDCPKVESGEARLASGMCGQGCIGDEDPNCASDCIVSETDMSADCASCYAEAVACATENCLSSCALDPTSDACTECQITEGCRDDFGECSGLPQ